MNKPHQTDPARQDRLDPVGWRDLVEDSPDMIWACGADGGCEYVNRRWIEYTGRSFDQNIGAGWLAAVAEADHAPLLQQWQRAQQRRESFCVDIRVCQSDGQQHWFMTCGNPVLGPDGKIRRWVGTCAAIDRLREAQEQARQNEQRLEFTLAAAKLGSWELNLRTGEIRHSPSYDAIFGYTEPMVWSCDRLRSHVEPNFRPLLDQAVSAAHEGQPWLLEFQIRRADGRLRWLWSRGEVSIDPQGHPEALRGVVQDITERKQMEQQRQELAAALEQRVTEMQTIFDSLQSPVFVFDAQGSLLRTNQAAGRLTGIQAEPLDCRQLEDFLHQLQLHRPDGRPVNIQEMPSRRALRGESVTGESLVFRSPAGREVSILATAAPLYFNGQIVGAVSSWHDITERERLLKQVSDLATSLEKRVLERTAELTESNRELEGFTYSVAHDLRAPLRHVAGFAHVLQRKAGRKLDAQEQQYLHNISSAIEQMGQLTDDLLKFSWASRVELRTGPVCLQAILAQARQVVEPEAHGRAVQWQVSALPVVEGDPALLQQVFVNLLSNALKFTRYTPQPRIEIDCQLLGSEAVIEVRDNGVGFDPQHAEKLFAIFERLHDPKQFEGTGVGLALVQRIVQRHGGSIQANGQVGQGATFRLSLPLAQAQPRQKVA